MRRCVFIVHVAHRFVDEYILPENVLEALRGREVSSVDISTHNVTDTDLRPDDVIVHNMKINYGSKVRMFLNRERRPCRSLL